MDYVTLVLNAIRQQGSVFLYVEMVSSIPARLVMMAMLFPAMAVQTYVRLRVDGLAADSQVYVCRVALVEALIVAEIIVILSRVTLPHFHVYKTPNNVLD